jgi:hypothetical protein
LSTFLCFLYFILSNFPLVLKVKCAKFHQNRSKTVDLHTKQTFKQRSNLARFYGIVATLATTRKAMEGRTKLTYVVIGRSGLSIYPIYIFSLWTQHSTASATSVGCFYPFVGSSLKRRPLSGVATINGSPALTGVSNVIPRRCGGLSTVTVQRHGGS